MSNEKREEFEKAAKVLIKFLNDNSHPHSTIIITTDSAELVEGVLAVTTKEFIKD